MTMRKIKPKMPGAGLDVPMNAKMSEKPIYPTIRIDLSHLPEAKSWKVGSDHTITLNLRMVGLSQSRYQNESEYEIRGVEIEDAKENSDEGGMEE